VIIAGRRLTNLSYADDKTMLVHLHKWRSVSSLMTWCYNMTINARKTKIVAVGKPCAAKINITSDNKIVE